MDKKLVKDFTDTELEIQQVQHEMTLATAEFIERLESLREQEDKMRADIMVAMEKNAVTKFENDVLRITYIAPSTRNSIDVARLKMDEPDLAAKYMKQSTIKASIRIKVKEEL